MRKYARVQSAVTRIAIDQSVIPFDARQAELLNPKALTLHDRGAVAATTPVESDPPRRENRCAFRVH